MKHRAVSHGSITVKVLFINGSPRKRGVTATILSVIRDNISPDHTIEWFDVYNLKIKPCYGCFKCRPNKKCVLPYDDAHLLSEKIKQADILIIGSPTYWGNIPGPLKTLFDRNVTTFEYVEAKSMKKPIPQLKGKKAIIVISSASPFPYNQMLSQSRGTIMALKTILKSGGIKILKILNVSSSYDFSNNEDKWIRKAKKIGESL